MLTMQNFMDRLAEISENADFNGWEIIDASDLVEDYYSIYLDKDKGKQFLKIRLHRKGYDEEMLGDKTYKLQFLNKNSYIIYEHWVTRNWLRKPAGDFMLRIGDIIEQFVVPHPRYKINY
jgi:hypothetical protein